MSNFAKLEKWLLPAAVAVYILIYFLFYPPIYAYRDEANYLSMAYVIRSGHLFIPIPETPMQAFIQEGGKVIPVYPLLHSLLLIPFTWIGWKTVFLLGFLSHLTGVFFVRKLAKQFSIDPILPSLLYLFYPPFLFYSRTIMTDVPSAALFLATVYYFYKQGTSKLVPGFLFGLLLILRTSNLLLLIPFGISLVVDAFKTKQTKNILLFTAGLIPLVLIQMGINFLYYGNPLAAGYSQGFPLRDQFGPEYFASNAKHYAVNLLICYPFLLPLFLLSKMRKTWEITALIATLFTFFSFYYFHDAFPGKLLTSVLGNRFLFPVIPFLILGYASALEKIPGRNIWIVILAVGLTCSGFIISRGHQTALLQQNEMREFIYSRTPENSVLVYDGNSAELLQIVWGTRTYFPYPDFKERVLQLSAGDFARGVYFIKRDFQYADKGLIPGLSESALAKNFNLTPLDHKGELTLYSLTPRISAS